MSRLVIYGRHPENLYHLSYINYDGKEFSPRVPDSILDDEDNDTPRVCFSSAISRCCMAILHPGMEVDLYVHKPSIPVSFLVRNKALYKPSVQDVPDVKLTWEYWVTQKIMLRCVGKIRVRYYVSTCKFRWLDKYS